MRALPLILLAACAMAGGDPYAGWKTAISIEGGYSIRFLAPPWEWDTEVEPPTLRLQVPFQHDVLAGSPAPPPAYLVLITPLRAETATDQEAEQAEQAMIDRGDEIEVPPRMFETRSNLVGYEVISIDATSRYHREAFLTLPNGVLHIEADSNDDIDERDMDDLIASIEPLP